MMDHLEQTMKDGNWHNAHQIAEAISRRLEKSGPQSIDAEELAKQDPVFAQIHADIKAVSQYAKKRDEQERQLVDTLMRDDTTKAAKQVVKARRDLTEAIWKNPTADMRDVVLDNYVKFLMQEQDFSEMMGKLAKNLRAVKDRKGNRVYSDEMIDRLQTDPQRLAELMQLETKAAFTNPLGDEIIPPKSAMRCGRTRSTKRARCERKGTPSITSRTTRRPMRLLWPGARRTSRRRATSPN